MSGFALHSFCDRCGSHRRQMPFGDSNPFWDRRPCTSCGEPGPGRHVIARLARIGFWPWQRGWVDEAGQQTTQNFGPRQDEGGEGVNPDDPPDGAECTPSQVQTKPAPDTEEQEGAESSREGGPSTSKVCICTDADDPNDHRKDCPMWGAGP